MAKDEKPKQDRGRKRKSSRAEVDTESSRAEQNEDDASLDDQLTAADSDLTGEEDISHEDEVSEADQPSDEAQVKHVKPKIGESKDTLQQRSKWFQKRH